MRVKTVRCLNYKRNITTWLLVMLFNNIFAQTNSYEHSLSDLGRYYVSKVEVNWHANSDSSLFYAREGLNRLKETDNLYDLALLHFSAGAAFSFAGQPDSALFYLNQCVDYSSTNRFDVLKHRALEQAGAIYADLKKFDQSLTILNQSLSFFESAGLPRNINSVLNNLGYLHYHQERYVMALSFFEKAATYNSQIVNIDPAAIALNQMSVGSIYNLLGDNFQDFYPEKSTTYYKTSIGFFETSLRDFQKLGHQMGVCYSLYNLTATYVDLKEFYKADSLLQHTIGCQNFPDDFLQIIPIHLKSEIIKARGDFEQARTILSGLLENKNSLWGSDHYHLAMIHYAELLRLSGLTDSAFNILTASGNWFLENENPFRAYKVSSTLADWYVKDGQNEKAIFYLQQAARLKNEVVKEINNEIFDELTLKYQNDVLKANLNAMEADQVMQKQRFRNTIILFGIILLLFITAFILLISTRKKNQALRRLADEKALSLERENQLHLAELEQNRLQDQLKQQENEKQQLEIQIKNQQLVYYTLREIAQTEFARKLSDQLSPFLQIISRKSDKEQFSEVLKEIRQEIKSNSMEQLEVMVKQMHSGFFEKLTAINPGLSRRELHFCALLRLNMSSKEISYQLKIELATVDRTRHNIRIKLNLQPHQNLNAFLMSV